MPSYWPSSTPFLPQRLFLPPPLTRNAPCLLKPFPKVRGGGGKRAVSSFIAELTSPHPILLMHHHSSAPRSIAGSIIPPCRFKAHILGIPPPLPNKFLQHKTPSFIEHCHTGPSRVTTNMSHPCLPEFHSRLCPIMQPYEMECSSAA